MNILKPELVWIENRCYRKLHLSEEGNKTYIEDDKYPTQPDEYKSNDEEEESSRLPIKYENYKFWISLPVPGPLIGYVCGKDRHNIKRIETSTGAQIKIPAKLHVVDKKRNKERSSEFVITSEKRPSVSDAYVQLRDIVVSGRWKVADDFTHFISVPLNSDVLQERFLKFKQDVLKISARGVEEGAFVRPSKLHLTLCMLTLLDEREKEEAKAALRECRTRITKMLGGRRLSLQVKGIEYMNDDDSEVDLLYGKVTEMGNGNLLQNITEELIQVFSDLNFAPPNHSVKLHVTLMRSKSGQEGRNSFDARPILQDFREYMFGELDLEEVHISIRHSSHNKYYTPLAVITL